MDSIDRLTLVNTRESLHAVAELLLAGPQYRESHDIRLRATPGGFGTVASPAVQVDGLALVTFAGRFALTGTIAEIAASAGLEPRALSDVYADTSELGLRDPLEIDQVAAARLAAAFAVGDQALRALGTGEEPVLWPEHFDIGLSAGQVNYGVSPGDATIAVPYAYVGPWEPRAGNFWNQPFGAARPIHKLGDVDAVVNFFEEGRALVAADE